MFLLRLFFVDDIALLLLSDQPLSIFYFSPTSCCSCFTTAFLFTFPSICLLFYSVQS